MRNGFIFYRSFFEALAELPDAERLAAYDAIMLYGMDGEAPQVSGIVSTVFKLCKPQIDANNRRYENGKRGGRPKKDNQGITKDKPSDNQTVTKDKPSDNQTVTKDKPKEKDKVKEKDKDKDKDKDSIGDKSPTPTKKRFEKPTASDVRAYCIEKGYSVDPDRFCDYYESNGWKVGKNPMKDWKAAVRTWSKSDARPTAKVRPIRDYGQRTDYDFDALERAAALEIQRWTE